jgi:phage terminase Nu1 subunit (DNA packaging protein)
VVLNKERNFVCVKAAKAEQQNAERAGRLVDAAAVEVEWSGVLRTVRAGMLAVPSRCGARLPHVAEIDAEIRAALTELGSSEDQSAGSPH